MSKPIAKGSAKVWNAYYRYTARQPPRELLIQTLNHLEWEKRSGRGMTAVELGFGAGTDALELLKRGWQVVGIERHEGAAKFLGRRVPARRSSALTTVVAPMEGLKVPATDLVYASFSLPFCSPTAFPALWSSIRKALRPGGHFAGQLFGDRDSWCGKRDMTFHTRRQVLDLARGLKVEMIREVEEEGMSFSGPKHWHYFDLILGNHRRSK